MLEMYFSKMYNLVSKLCWILICWIISLPIPVEVPIWICWIPIFMLDTNNIKIRHSYKDISSASILIRPNRKFKKAWQWTIQNITLLLLLLLLLLQSSVNTSSISKPLLSDRWRTTTKARNGQSVQASVRIDVNFSLSSQILRP